MTGGRRMKWFEVSQRHLVDGFPPVSAISGKAADAYFTVSARDSQDRRTVGHHPYNFWYGFTDMVRSPRVRVKIPVTRQERQLLLLRRGMIVLVIAAFGTVAALARLSYAHDVEISHSTLVVIVLVGIGAAVAMLVIPHSDATFSNRRINVYCCFEFRRVLDDQTNSALPDPPAQLFANIDNSVPPPDEQPPPLPKWPG